MHRHAVAGCFVVASIAGLCGNGTANDSVGVPTFGYEVLNAWPHDPGAYTQGLVVENGVLYESTGRYGASSLRIVDLATGRIEKIVNLPDKYFGEGIAVLGDRVFQLTWRERTGFIYDRRTLARVGE
ncbi:MAG TPA: glutaminyl-peptide cyclotransferase, partial [Burkholderiales bacterium]|nr:glutaminyl-peptide cyclotransferase [Burkholderiales bacterium]